jgi:hypothetical protein
MTPPPPLSPELEALFGPLREPLPLPPVVVSRVMARAVAAAELTPHRRRRVGAGSWWMFAAVGGAVLTLGAGAYAARAWIHTPAASPAPAAAAPRLWPSSRRAPRSVAAVVPPPTVAPEPVTRKRNSGRGVTTNAELQLLRTARQDVTRGDHAGALSAIGQHRRRFQNGTLVEEREALRVKALAGLGRAKEAQAAAAAFRTRFPHSVFLSTFERL